MSQELPKIIHAAYTPEDGGLLHLHTDPNKLRKKISQEESVDPEAISTIELHWRVLKIDGACLCWSTNRPRRPWERAGFDGVASGELERRALEECYPKPSNASEALALYRRMIAEGWERDVAVEFIYLRGYLSEQEHHPSTIEEGLDKIRALRAEGIDPAKIALWAIGWNLGLESLFGGLGLP